jgi:phosphoribosylpyrophosphate synthetase
MEVVAQREKEAGREARGSTEAAVVAPDTGGMEVAEAMEEKEGGKGRAARW